MKIKINQLFYQRNGVHGTGFYSMTFVGKIGKQSWDMIATFESDQDDKIVYTSCRVVALALPTTAWDGWSISLDIEKEIKTQTQQERGYGDLYSNNGLYTLLTFDWK